MKEMFNQFIFDFHRSVIQEDAEPLFIVFYLMLLLMFIFFTIGSVGYLGSGSPDYAVPFIVGMGATFFVMATLFVLAEAFIGWAGRFVTRDEWHFNNAASRWLFGDIVAGETEDTPWHDSQYYFGPWERHMFFTFLAFVAWLVGVLIVAIPVFTITVLTLVALVMGGLVMARKAFDVSRSLKHHVNNKEIHRSE